VAGAGERSYDPTPKRLKEAQQEGRVARTPDLSAWAVVAATACMVPFVVRQGAGTLADRLAALPDVADDPTPERALAELVGGAGDAVTLLLPVVAAAVLAAVVASWAQSGLRLATKAAKPKLKNLNPVQGIKRLFGPQTWWEGAKTLLKVGVVAVAMWSVVDGLLPGIAVAGRLPLSATVAATASAAATLLWTAAGAGVVVAAADYAMAKRRIMKQLRMTHQEVKEEHKQSEGDPQLKGQIRARQVAMSRNRMMREIATADVVLVNPTHVAVALRYEQGKGAPRVVAKGAGHVAARIRERALEERVPLVQDVPLARALHAACEVGQEIPAEVYAAVARVLAFVLNLRSRGSAAGLHRVPALAGSH
jgi:flagellar biosynthesis protein FlhB